MNTVTPLHRLFYQMNRLPKSVLIRGVPSRRGTRYFGLANEVGGKALRVTTMAMRLVTSDAQQTGLSLTKIRLPQSQGLSFHELWILKSKK